MKGKEVNEGGQVMPGATAKRPLEGCTGLRGD